MVRVDLATQFADVRTRVATQRTTPAADAIGPKFRRMRRKETLLRADQIDDLAALARRCMQRRRSRTERITENSLVRIAVDLLLDNHDLLEGSTEKELADAIRTKLAGYAEFSTPTTEAAPLAASRPAAARKSTEREPGTSGATKFRSHQ